MIKPSIFQIWPWIFWQTRFSALDLIKLSQELLTKNRDNFSDYSIDDNY